jgi:hypothetical protein
MMADRCAEAVAGCLFGRRARPRGWIVCKTYLGRHLKVDVRVGGWVKRWGRCCVRWCLLNLEWIVHREDPFSPAIGRGRPRSLPVCLVAMQFPSAGCPGPSPLCPVIPCGIGVLPPSLPTRVGCRFNGAAPRAGYSAHSMNLIPGLSFASSSVTKSCSNAGPSTCPFWRRNRHCFLCWHTPKQ